MDYAKQKFVKYTEWSIRIAEQVCNEIYFSLPPPQPGPQLSQTGKVLCPKDWTGLCVIQ